MAEKRKAGRTPKTASNHPAKKTRLSSHIKQETPEIKSTTQTPVAEEEEDVKPALLPNRIYDGRPLPTLPTIQPTDLSNDEYQSIEGSGLLAASLERTRQKWLSGEFFERYWVKTSGRKDAQKVAPDGNPLKVWMKHSGTCTIIIEPMIFETQFYVSHEPAITAAVQQKNAVYQPQQPYGAPSPYGTPYGGSTQSPSQSGCPSQSRPQAPPQSSNGRPQQQQQHAPQKQVATTAPATPAKQSPDPVIQLLASRAATDANLKELMKIVATGSATPEQLKAFQGHIDELNQVVAAQNAAQTPASLGSENRSPAVPPNTTNMQPTQVATPKPPQPKPAQAPVRQRSKIEAQYPAVFEFMNAPGASVDRFRFPRHSIIESLGSQSILASFLVFRKGKDAADPSLYDAETEYFEPITVKIDVTASNVKVLEDIKKSVAPAAEVRTWMEDQMRTKKRAPTRYLPLKLPHKSQLTESEEENELPLLPAEVKKRPYKKKADKEKEEEAVASPAPPVVPAPPPPPAPAVVPDPMPVNSTTEGPRRTSRRSTRMSEVMAM